MKGHWSIEAAEVPLFVLASFAWQVLECGFVLLDRNGPSWPLEAVFSELLVQ